jgi:endonuclease-3 related protein
VGAYLTQNTAWINVEKALANLRQASILTVKGIRECSLPDLERLIRPSGYFRQKALRLKTFVRYLDDRYQGSLGKMFARPTGELRKELLALNGVGLETADSILLYAGNHPIFVADAYTRRILSRHAMLAENAPYEEVRELVQQALAPLAEPTSHSAAAALEQLPAGLHGGASVPVLHSLLVHSPSKMSASKRTALTQVYNEMHGLIVGVGKTYCKKSQPLCDGCPLQPFLPHLK